jgi:hypothetical protein
MATESRDLVIAKRLLDHAKLRGFQFQRVTDARTAHCWAPAAPTSGPTPSISTASAATATRCASAPPPCSYQDTHWWNAAPPAMR